MTPQRLRSGRSTKSGDSTENSVREAVKENEKAEDAPSAAPSAVSEAVRANPLPAMSLEALYAENSRLKQQVARQRAEIQELRAQGQGQQVMVSEPVASYLGQLSAF